MVPVSKKVLARQPLSGSASYRERQQAFFEMGVVQFEHPCVAVDYTMKSEGRVEIVGMCKSMIVRGQRNADTQCPFVTLIVPQSIIMAGKALPLGTE